VTLLSTQTIKIVYVGQGGTLSCIPLIHLIKAGIVPEAIIIPQQSLLPKGQKRIKVQPPLLEHSLAKTAVEQDILLIEWQKACMEEIEVKLASIAPDLVIMSCFPWRIPDSLITIPKLGWWNLHPSLLPAYRGPAPLFWQARAGEAQTGITLHQVVSELDSGDILAQQVISMRNFKRQQLEAELAYQGAKLIQQALLKQAEGNLKAKSQGALKVSYQGFPSEQDFCISTTGSARAAFMFIQLMAQKYPLWLQGDNKKFRVHKALSVNEQGDLGERLLVEGNKLSILFEQGVLVVVAEEIK